MRPLPNPARSPSPPMTAGAAACPEPAGLGDLDDRSLLALLLGRCGRGADGDRLAADVSELGRMDGLGASGLLDLKLLREIAVRLARSAASARPVLSSWTALLAYSRTTLAHLPREQFRALYLDRRNILLRDELVTDGTVDHAPVYPREVIRRALELSASALILVHNHPSGDPTPSQADIAMTRQIVDGAKLFGLQVHDHLVIGREGTASFRSLGLF